MNKIIMVGLMGLLSTNAFADGRVVVEEPPVVVIQKSEPVAPVSTLKERLISFILQHPELPRQQDLLKQVLETKDGVENVLKALPEKDQKTIRG